ncbi:MAG TPA: hypothetical protein VGC97_04720 [Pyrinomonadaceae bacterium]|jgi:hypothetical protein
MSADAKNEFSEKRGQFWLWVGLLLPPAAWAIQLQTVYLASEYGCKYMNFMPNHLASVFALLLSIIGGVIAWRNWIESGKQWEAKEANPQSRSRFMAILGMMTAALFTLLIFAQWLPTLLGVPCDK